jgi:hypothetical protein
LARATSAQSSLCNPWTAVLIASVAFLVGCGSPEQSASGPYIDVLGADRASTLDVGKDRDPGDVHFDVSPPPDSLFETLISPGEAGYPCASAEDCLSGYCIATQDGRKCSVECETECPFGWECNLYKPSLPDAIYICAPALMNLCRPCKTNSDCATNGVDGGDACIPYGSAGSFCGGECTAHSCPPGYECTTLKDVHGGEVEQCELLLGECSCADWFVNEAAQTDCFVENEWGKCGGTRMCAANGLTSCSAPVPQEEVCNGLDEDCDEEADESFVDTDNDGEADCVDADDDADGVLDTWDNCPEVPNPMQNDLDGDGLGDGCDDDMDGDLLPNAADNCPEVSNPGQADADEDGAGDACESDDDGDGDPDGSDCAPLDPLVHHGATETCNGVDDNCAGGIDEGFSDSDWDGVKDCTDPDDDNDGDPDLTDCEPMNPAVHHGAAESCNGVDDDCDGEVDEDLGTVECGLGDCFHAAPACKDAKLQFCNPYEGSKAETCDGKDNNCDGMADDGYDLGLPCVAGLGKCAVSGFLVCAPNGKSATCDADPADPDCGGKQCGDDGCGGICGDCPAWNYSCANGTCLCVPNCLGKECGDDLCGGECGICKADETCNDGICNGCDDGNDVAWDGCTDGEISEFRVNSISVGDQSLPVVGVFPNGGFIVAWLAYNWKAVGAYGVFARLFHPDGSPLGDDFLLSQEYGANMETRVSLSILEGNRAVVAWETLTDNGITSTTAARVVSWDGTLIGPPFKVSPELASTDQGGHAVAALPDGGFLVAWSECCHLNGTESWGDVRARLFGPDYAPAGEAFWVNTSTKGGQGHPAPAVFPNGSFVVAWHSGLADGQGSDVHAQLFAQDGKKQGAEFVVNDATFLNQEDPDAVLLASGEVLIAWDGYGDAFYHDDIWGQRVSPDGSKVGSQILLNQHVDESDRLYPRIAAFGKGGGVAVWLSAGVSPATSIVGQRFDSAYKQDGAQFVANACSECVKLDPDVASSADDGFVVVWTSKIGQDPFGAGVFAQRFNADGTKRYH